MNVAGMNGCPEIKMRSPKYVLNVKVPIGTSHGKNKLLLAESVCYYKQMAAELDIGNSLVGVLCGQHWILLLQNVLYLN